MVVKANSTQIIVCPQDNGGEKRWRRGTQRIENLAVCPVDGQKSLVSVQPAEDTTF